MVTIRDVSQKAGVSRSTASRVIAKNGYVSEDARKAVEAAIEQLGYRPNALAQGLRSSRSNTIGGVVVNIASPFYGQMISGAQQICRANGKFILVSSGYADQAEESRAIIELVDRSCDGLVLYLENPMREDVAEIIRKSELPVVTIGWSDVPVARGSVKIDNYAGAYMQARHLLERGHRSMIHLGGLLSYGDARDRWRGIMTALADFDLSDSDIYVEHGEFDESFGYEATRRLIKTLPPFTAILAGDDDIAAGAMLALKREGKRCPDDISVIGFDDNFHARHLTPSLTTIRQPMVEAGRLAVEMLLQILNQEGSAVEAILLPTLLIERESVRTLTP